MVTARKEVAMASKMKRTELAGEHACGKICSFAGVNASCSDRIQFGSTHDRKADPAPCAASRKDVIDYCPICGNCELEYSGCKSSQKKAELACAKKCEFAGMSASCSDRIKWGSTHQMQGQAA